MAAETREEFDLEFPPGSQKRQEEIWRREKLETDTPEPVAEVPVVEPDKVPESVWRGNG